MQPRLIGQYRVTGILGQGGMGIVYAAEHTLLGRPAAVKVLLPRFSGEQEIVTRFFNEARAATSIRNPGIVEIYDFGWTDNGSAFIVMEYLQGETLRARRQRTPMRWSTALGLVRQIAGALSAAHAKGIVHRDLKPDNIFVVPDLEVPGGTRIKLLDFGIAKLTDMADRHKTQTGALMGTPAYMAPEQCRGVAVDERADLYALGCILFELCTGSPPFLGEGTGDVLSAHIHQRPPTIKSLAGGIPAEIESLVQRLLAKAPADRVQTANELIGLIDAAKVALGSAALSGQHPTLMPADGALAATVPPDSRQHQPHADTTPVPTQGNTVALQPRRDATPVSTRADTTPIPARRDPTPISTRADTTPIPARRDTTTMRPRRDATPIPARTDMAPIPAHVRTTLSSAIGIQSVETARSPRRWFAILGVAGALALAAVIVLVVGVGREGDNPAEVAVSSASATTVPTMETRPPQVQPQPPVHETPPAPVPPPPVAEPAPTPPVAEPAPTPRTPTSPEPDAAPSTSSTTPFHASPSTTDSASLPPRSKRSGSAAPTSTLSSSTSIQVTIDTDPRDAEILLDGKRRIGRTPWSGTLQLVNQKVKLVLRLEGHADQPLYISKANAYMVRLKQRVSLPALP